MQIYNWENTSETGEMHFFPLTSQVKMVQRQNSLFSQLENYGKQKAKAFSLELVKCHSE